MPLRRSSANVTAPNAPCMHVGVLRRPPSAHYNTAWQPSVRTRGVSPGPYRTRQVGSPPSRSLLQTLRLFCSLQCSTVRFSAAQRSAGEPHVTLNPRTRRAPASVFVRTAFNNVPFPSGYYLPSPGAWQLTRTMLYITKYMSTAVPSPVRCH